MSFSAPDALARKMGKKIREKLKENPRLLEPRTPEEIAAILVKETEKSRLQLEALQKGKDWTKLDPNALQDKLLSYVPKVGGTK